MAGVPDGDPKLLVDGVVGICGLVRACVDGNSTVDESPASAVYVWLTEFSPLGLPRNLSVFWDVAVRFW